MGDIYLNGTGKWYVKFIRMTLLGESQVNYESKWATLTFEGVPSGIGLDPLIFSKASPPPDGTPTCKFDR
jgi:hypothetical protein